MRRKTNQETPAATVTHFRHALGVEAMAALGEER
jgi:hypothetical protein